MPKRKRQLVNDDFDSHKDYVGILEKTMGEKVDEDEDEGKE